MAMAPDDHDLMQQALNDDPELAAFFADQRNCSYYQFKPRPNQPELWDEQQAFVENKDDVAFLIGGNASGTTVAGCAKLANMATWDTRGIPASWLIKLEKPLGATNAEIVKVWEKKK